MRLENRVVKLESRSPDALPIWDSIILEGEHAKPEEQARIDAFHAMGHSVLIRRIIEPNGLPEQTGAHHET